MEENPIKHYLLFYDYVHDYLERRAAFRSEHLSLAWQAHERGELMLGGILGDPVDGAVLWFQGTSAAVAEDFVGKDPYVKHGLVSRWSIRPWLTAVGSDAVTPTRG